MSRVLSEIADLDGAIARGDVAPSDALARLDPARIGAALFQSLPDEAPAARLVAAAPGVGRGVLATSLADARAEPPPPSASNVSPPSPSVAGGVDTARSGDGGTASVPEQR